QEHNRSSKFAWAVPVELRLHFTILAPTPTSHYECDKTMRCFPDRVTESFTMPDNPLTDPLAWRAAKAPSVVDMETLARKVFAGLPDKFRSLCEGLIIRVEDFAPDDVLDDLDIESEFDLMGLFQGVGLPFQSSTAPVQLPNMIW